MVSIKICGITKEQETLWLNEAGVDYAGFVFYEKSKRNLSVKKARQILKELNKDIKKVAVTVSPGKEQLFELEKAGFDRIQIHGEWDMSYAKDLKIPVWRAVNLKNMADIIRLKQYLDSPDVPEAVLVDAGTFGSGKTFGWDKEHREWQKAFEICRSRLKERGILFAFAGGLTPYNVAEGIRLFTPDIVDVSSGVENDTLEFTGKDRKKIEAFCKSCRKAWLEK